ncbi:hypothetical protein [Cryobacterium zhongshanensis]|uniref:Uncharacterized protein n=1 Tax=Cryobacterium zhongshanensis TaxID=2928153 RepID=A0AA41QY53_9MICO|nr:hypothetical protein [Cryobacterium zhongshanensis]MCI4659637.1 hypothetical protein [Cryobacterium zhongshanensis]
MNDTIKIEDALKAVLDEALVQGFHVFVTRPTGAAATRFAYVCRDLDGPFAVVNAPQFFGPPSIQAPIKPSRKYGSSVQVNYDGTIADALRALEQVCASENVTVLYSGLPAPVVPNHRARSITSWPGGADRFVDLAA